jgi:chromosome segregation ATPase
MGMLSMDYPRVKTKEEKKQDKINEIEHSIKYLSDELDEVEGELKDLLNPDFLKKKIKRLNSNASSFKERITNLKKKLNKLTRKD